MAETILIVDDEEPVRRTFREWLEGAADLDARILSAADAENALLLANQEPIDLAVLDWNLGAGNDGLQLLEDLCVFNPDVVAVMVTGFAHQATPLDAMRMGVRDYLDKNQDLDRNTFLTVIRRQLERIRPAKRERRLHQGLVAFREAVDKILPLVESAAALNDPVPLPQAIGSLFRFLLRATHARDGVLLVRAYDPAREPAETCRAYDASGQPLAGPLAPFARSVAGSVVSRAEPSAIPDLLRLASEQGVELQPFERGRQSLLAVALPVASGVHAVLELFDKPTAFTPEDHQLLAAAADFGTELLRHALAERQTQRVLFDAIGTALGAGESLAASLHGTARQRQEEPPPAAVMDRLREGLNASNAPVAGDETLRLIEAVRVLALRHGPAAVRHCIQLIESVRTLLDEATGASAEG